MLATILSILAMDGLWGPSGSQDLLILRHHRGVLMKQRDRLVRDNSAFRERITRLNSDNAYLQQLIRQELGYVRPDEFVYRFPSSEQP